MKTKYKLALLVCAAVLFGAWEVRPNFNRPKSVALTVNASSIIPVMFKTRNGIHLSNVMRDLDGKGYSHIGVISDVKHPISLATSEFESGNSVVSTEKLYVASSGTATYDSISVFKYLFIMSEDGNSVLDGKLKIMVW